MLLLRPAGRSRLFALGGIFLFILVLLYVIATNHYQIKNAFSYATRPLWDKAEGPTKIVSHYYAEGMEVDSYMCQLHGWQERSRGENIKVLDAVLMSSELDLLEIRMNELGSVVDRFFILESNATFTGLEKETYFAKNKGRFAKFEEKISYHFLPGFPLERGQDPFDVEATTRNEMTMFLKQEMARLYPDSKHLVIMSDLDELPSSATIRLLKGCDFGEKIHLQLKNYLYSFEWFLGYNSWRSSVHLWQPDTYYRHSQSTDIILADAGWHCSYCFRTIKEYALKMQGFSHADRIGGRIDLLKPERLQEMICKGTDPFGMLPEAYTYADLLYQMNPIPQTSAVGLPRYLIYNVKTFSFLLPGGCMREA